jgi:arabinofuranosyltransferase
VPLGCLLLALGALAGWHRGGWNDRWDTLAVTLLPVVAGIVMAVYVTRVGGDFMHGRMLLPAITAVLLPVLLVPATRGTALPAAGAAVWFGLAVTGLGVSYADRTPDAGGIYDERAFWSRAVGSEHPVSAADFIQETPLVRRSVPAVQRVGEPSLLLIEVRRGPDRWRPYPSRDGVAHSTVPFLNLGMMGAAQPLDVRVADPIGLANPLARHATPVFGGRIGHDKDLPTAWFVADEVRRGVPVPFDQTAVLDARRAVQCPDIAEMLASVRAPLTPQRFWDNLTGAVERTGFRYSRLPALAADDCES